MITIQSSNNNIINNTNHTNNEIKNQHHISNGDFSIDLTVNDSTNDSNINDSGIVNWDHDQDVSEEHDIDSKYNYENDYESNQLLLSDNSINVDEHMMSDHDIHNNHMLDDEYKIKSSNIITGSDANSNDSYYNNELQSDIISSTPPITFEQLQPVIPIVPYYQL